MKVKFDGNQLEKLDIVDKLRKLHGVIDTSKSHDLSLLAARLCVDERLLLDVLLSMDVCIYQDDR